MRQGRITMRCDDWGQRVVEAQWADSSLYIHNAQSEKWEMITDPKVMALLDLPRKQAEEQKHADNLALDEFIREARSKQVELDNALDQSKQLLKRRRADARAERNEWLKNPDVICMALDALAERKSVPRVRADGRFAKTSINWSRDIDVAKMHFVQGESVSRIAEKMGLHSTRIRQILSYMERRIRRPESLKVILCQEVRVKSQSSVVA